MGHFTTLREIFKPWYIKAGSALAIAFAAINGYAALQDQFPTLPKLQEVVVMAHVLPLPWWGWLLVVQSIFLYALYEYVRRGVPAPHPNSGRLFGDTELAQGIVELSGDVAEIKRDAAQVQAFKNALAATNTRFDSWKDELCNRIQQSSDYREKQDKVIFEAIEKIKSQIAIDLPNASTLADAFRNLDQAVHSQILRISEQIQGYSDRLNRDNLSLQHLLYFAMQLSAENTLVYLLSRAPVIGEHEQLDLTEDAHQKNQNFLDVVSSGLSGTQRQSDFRHLLYEGEAESDRRLRELPNNQWTTEGVNPIVLRQYFIAGLTRRRVVYYLEKELAELQEKIRQARSTMFEQYDQRQKKPN